MTGTIGNRIAAGLEARRSAHQVVAKLEALSQRYDQSEVTSSVRWREPKAIPEKLAAFMELADRTRTEADRPRGRDGRPSVAGVTDRLPPAYDGETRRADNHVSKLHTEIRLDGKVVARIYNSGAAELADDHAYLGREFGGETITGPELAERRLAMVTRALARGGAIISDGTKPAPASRFGGVIAEITRVASAQTQQEWLAFKAAEGSNPGGVFSRTA